MVLLGQHGDVVLEGVRDPETLVADVRDTLVGVPVLLLGQGLVNAVVEVLVVGEDNVATNIVQLQNRPSLDLVLSSCWGKGQSTYETFGSDICGGETTSLLAGVNDQPRGALNLVQTLGSTYYNVSARSLPFAVCTALTKTGRARANNENIDVAVQLSLALESSGGQLDSGGAVCIWYAKPVCHCNGDQQQWIKQLLQGILTCQPFCFLLLDLWW